MAKPTQRYACDRCHGQKLRCIHTASGPCVRCAKAKATCSWSQSLRSRRPDSNFPIGRIDQHAPLPDTTPIVNYPSDLFTSQTPSSNIRSELDLGPSQIQFPVSPGVAPPEVTVRYPSPASQEPPNNYNYTPQSSDGGPDIITDSMNWLGPADANGITQDASQVCWQHLFNQEWALLSSQPAVNGSSNPVIDDAGNTPKTPCLLPIIRQLSELNVELYAHSIVIPKPPESLSEPVSWRNKDFAIDRTFQLSQRLIEITNKKYPLYLETASTDISNASSINTLQSSGLQPDQGFCLLILSCYTRLVDTYDRIFANMQACLDRSSVTAREDYVNLPSVQVGSFSLPQSSATQIVLILQLARHLLGRMGEIIKAIGLDKQHNNRDAENDDLITESTTGPEKLLLMSALDTVRPQEDCLMKRITKLRTTLIELNIL